MSTAKCNCNLQFHGVRVAVLAAAERQAGGVASKNSPGQGLIGDSIAVMPIRPWTMARVLHLFLLHMGCPRSQLIVDGRIGQNTQHEEGLVDRDERSVFHIPQRGV